MIPGVVVAIGAGAAALWAVRRLGAPSLREDLAESWDVASIPAAIEDSIGWPYWYGRGSPATPWSDGPLGVDCSGYAQMALVRLGLLSPSEPDRSAAALAEWCLPVAVGNQEPGDLAYYPGHVMVVCEGYTDDGHSPVIGASGGTAVTFGTNPGARVKVFDSALYRADFVTYMRPPR